MATSPFVGTAGWSYPSWKGLVFPKTTAVAEHPLVEVARRLDTVEINSTFYRHLKPEVARLWMAKVKHNPRFLFTAKLHQTFTHARVLEQSEIRECQDGLLPLLRAKKLGAVLMQFPWSFRFTGENREFLLQLRQEFSAFPLVAEMRHASWMAEEAIGTFIDFGIGFCNIDQPAYTSAMPPTAYLTSPVGYVRLHGRNPDNSLGAFGKDVARTAQHNYLYSPAELQEWKTRIEKINRFAERTFVVFNNDAAGKSYVNALQTRALLTGEYAVAPLSLRRKYPMELEDFAPRFAQQELFAAA